MSLWRELRRAYYRRKYQKLTAKVRQRFNNRLGLYLQSFDVREDLVRERVFVECTYSSTGHTLFAATGDIPEPWVKNKLVSYKYKDWLEKNCPVLYSLRSQSRFDIEIEITDKSIQALIHRPVNMEVGHGMYEGLSGEALSEVLEHEGTALTKYIAYDGLSVADLMLTSNKKLTRYWRNMR